MSSCIVLNWTIDRLSPVENRKSWLVMLSFYLIYIFAPWLKIKFAVSDIQTVTTFTAFVLLKFSECLKPWGCTLQTIVRGVLLAFSYTSPVFLLDLYGYTLTQKYSILTESPWLGIELFVFFICWCRTSHMDTKLSFSQQLALNLFKIQVQNFLNPNCSLDSCPAYPYSM